MKHRHPGAELPDDLHLKGFSPVENHLFESSSITYLPAMRIIRGASLPAVPASHEDPTRPGVLKQVLAKKGELLHGHVQMINWATLPARASFRAHFHEDMQEVFIILSGTSEMRTEKAVATLGAGDCAVIDPREIHEMRNVGAEQVTYIVIGISSEQGGKTIVVERS